MDFDFSISTSWNSWREPDADKMIDEIKSFGFNRVELDFALPVQTVERIIQLVEQGTIQVSSLHNFCPIPEHVNPKYASPNMFLISDKDPQKRQESVKYTFNTIDYAVKLGAEAVVMHSGEIPIKNKTNDLILLMRQDKQDSFKFIKTKVKHLTEREKLRNEYIQYTLESLDAINDYAIKKNVKIGIENRYYIHEIPDLEEIELILNQFKGGNLFYWHDMGHAQHMENLHVFYHEEYLNAFKNRLLGMHIHDIVRDSDHRAPGCGVFDFTRVIDYLTKDIIKVLEVHHPTSPSELKSGIKFLKDLLQKENGHQ